MTAKPGTAMPSAPDRPRWGWALLGLALAWVVVARVPLVLNARAHLDSDLAVDGLTLIDALNGHWRWHYPATPFIGSPPVLLSWVQAKVWGSNPMTLASGGVVAYALVVVGAYLWNRRAFGPTVAAWGLVPLAFASTGTVWLSGRVTGGHLLAAAWHAGAFALLWDALAKGGWRRSAALGLWCGFGLYVDSMFALTWVGIGVGACVLAFFKSPSGSKEEDRGRRIIRSISCLLAFGLACGLGVMPRVVGSRVDPHDAYSGQLDPDIRLDRIKKNAWILVGDCLPRLIAGHRLPGLQSDPNPFNLTGRLSGPTERGIPWPALTLAVFSLYLFARAMVALASGGMAVDPAGFAVRWGLLASSAALVGGFLVNRTIVNSDNYRYLVFLLVPWSSGFGLMMARGTSRPRLGHCVNWALAVAFAISMTVDSAQWYARFGWVDGTVQPVRKVVKDPALDWLESHPETSAILGDYWDVYRLAFLTGGRVRGMPFPEYPDRFPEWKRDPVPSRSRVIIVRPDGFGPRYRARAMAMGAREVARVEGLSIVEWPEGLTP